MRTPPWLALLALVVGVLLGVLYAWVISPLRYVDTAPSTLRADFKDSFRSVIAASYAATHNLERARARLDLLGDPSPIDALSAQAQRMLAAGQPFQNVRDVAQLASDLRSGSVANIAPPTLTAAIAATTTGAPTPSPSLSVTGQADITNDTTPTEAAPTLPAFDTPTPRPTRTPIPTASAPFQLLSKDQVCNANLTDGLMQISILDSHHHQMPGVEIHISWNGGEESFFTGFKPEIGDGYADYVMQPGITYAVRVERSGAPVTGLTPPSCPDTNGQSYLGGLKLVFQQP